MQVGFIKYKKTTLFFWFKQKNLRCWNSTLQVSHLPVRTATMKGLLPSCLEKRIFSISFQHFHEIAFSKKKQKKQDCV